MLTVKLRLTAVSDAQYGGVTTGSNPDILGVARLPFRQPDSTPTATVVRSVLKNSFPAKEVCDVATYSRLILPLLVGFLKAPGNDCWSEVGQLVSLARSVE